MLEHDFERQSSGSGENTITNSSFILRVNQHNEFPGHVLFHEDQLPNSDLVEIIGSREIILAPIKNERVQQNEIWVDKFIKDNYLRNDTEVSLQVSGEKWVAALVEVGVKDLYISRIDMVMLVAELDYRCIAEGQKINLYSLKDPRTQGINCTIQINHIYNSSGHRMKKGAVIRAKDTRFSFRSGTGLFHILIQVSKEMFCWDAYGYMQYQRATNGFLSTLFKRWKDENSGHETQIIFFARHMYSIETMQYTEDVTRNFPPAWRKQVHRDDEEYAYIDFYRSIYVPNRLTDEIEYIVQKCREVLINWKNTAIIKFEDGRTAPLLKDSFNQRSINDEPFRGFELSSAANGNFLQTINMSLHIFEKHQTDRSLYRTGQMILTITAGVGVFEVDYRNSTDRFINQFREFNIKTESLKTNMENRIRDLGIGCDLVCLGEQPLHAVPLLRIIVSGDENQYEKPDFINLNYYRESPITVDENMAMIAYVPRIGLHYVKSENFLARSNSLPVTSDKRESKNDIFKPPQTCEEMDEYDKKIFMSGSQIRRRLQSQFLIKRQMGEYHGRHHVEEEVSHSLTELGQPRPRQLYAVSKTQRKRTTSNDSLHGRNRNISESQRIRTPLQTTRSHLRSESKSPLSPSITSQPRQIPNHRNDFNRKRKPFKLDFGSSLTDSFERRQCGLSKGGSEHELKSSSLQQKCESLLNPFKPSKCHTKHRNCDENNHQFLDLFLTDFDGKPIKPHVKAVRSRPMIISNEAADSFKEYLNAVSSQQTYDPLDNPPAISSRPSSPIMHRSHDSLRHLLESVSQENYMREGTGCLQMNSADTRIGVDWRSLTTPGCLPLTTPKRIPFEYLMDVCRYKIENPKPAEGNKNDDIDTGDRADYGPTMDERFFELQCQRIAQGFQYLRKTDWREGTKSKRLNKESKQVALTLSPYVTIITLESNMHSGKEHKVIVLNTFCKTHVIQYDKQPSIYTFAFCGKYNDVYEPLQTTFLTRFRGKKYLGFSSLDQIVQQPACNPDDSDDYKTDWDHYSWRCRYVFIPEKDKCVSSYKTEDYNRQIKNDFVQLLTYVVNELVPVRKQGSRSRNSTASSTSQSDSASSGVKRVEPNADNKKPSPGIQTSPGDTKPSEPVCAEAAFETYCSMIKKCAPSYTVSGSISPNRTRTVYLAIDIIKCLIENGTCKDINQAKMLLESMQRSNKHIQMLRSRSNCPPVEYGTFLYYFPDKKAYEDKSDSDDDDIDGLPKYDDDYDDEEYQVVEVKLPEHDKQTWINQTSIYDVKKSRNSNRETVKRIIPRRPLKKMDPKVKCRHACCKNSQERIEWYQIYYCPDYNPCKEAFSLLFQWLVASPVVILDKVSQWEMKTRRFGYRVFPCPETPFSVEWDAFRDWHYFNVNWDTKPEAWNNQVSIKTILIDVSSSLLFDLGYYADSFWPTSQYCGRGLNENTFQYIHRTGFALVQLKCDKQNIPCIIRWTRNPLLGNGRKMKESFETEREAERIAVNKLKQIFEFPSKPGSDFFTQYKLLTS